jgi:hypothetical protein
MVNTLGDDKEHENKISDDTAKLPPEDKPKPTPPPPIKPLPGPNPPPDQIAGDTARI